MTKRLIKTGNRKRPVAQRIDELERQVLTMHQVLMEMSAIIQGLTAAARKEVETRGEKSNLIIP
jgi:Mg2+ and Co2+ transporter CorA